MNRSAIKKFYFQMGGAIRIFWIESIGQGDVVATISVFCSFLPQIHIGKYCINRQPRIASDSQLKFVVAPARIVVS